MKNKVRIKPHHLIDIIIHFGKGERSIPPDLDRGHAQHLVAEKVLGDPGCVVIMETGIDDICTPCRFVRDGVCTDKVDPAFHGTPLKHEYNKGLDERWMARLGIRNVQEYTVRAFCELLTGKTGELEKIYPFSTPEYLNTKQNGLQEGIKRYLSLPFSC